MLTIDQNATGVTIMQRCLLRGLCWRAAVITVSVAGVTGLIAM